MSPKLSLKIIITTLSLFGAISIVKGQDDPGSPLFLTPLIKGGEAVAARDAALVKEVFSENVISYSGFITINETQNSNLFFWFFPSEETYGESFYDNDAPIILWSDGGPGTASLLTIFNFGPFLGNEADGTFKLNPFSWHKKYHRIYLDNPVDVGFSFTDHEDGFVYSSDQAAVGIYEFLTQFFTMFPYLQKNKFFNAGASYGGKYGVDIAYLIHQNNQNNPEVPINLQGVISDSPWYEGLTQSIYGDFLFNAGMISAKSLQLFHEKEREAVDLTEQGKYLDAFMVWGNLVMEISPELVGFDASYHIQNEHRVLHNMTDLIVNNSSRKAIHVGSRRFFLRSGIAQERFLPTFVVSVKSKLDMLLKEGYRVLIYVGNMDYITNHLGVQNVLSTLTWEHANELLDGPRYIWKDDKGVAGYVTTAASNSSAFVVYRNAGHGVCADEGERCFQMITKFVDGNNNW